jgi:GNAT superfamily N-acetyltransferase
MRIPQAGAPLAETDAMNHHTWSRDKFTNTTDPARLDLDVIHGCLRESYWSPGIPRAVVERAVSHSLCFGLYESGQQIGFARVVTDRATFAYIADVFVLPEHRGQGLSKWLMACIAAHPDLQNLRRWMLMTRDAHGLYEQFGFKSLNNPGSAMERWDPEVYQRLNTS